jgi:hypothetical protein
MWSIFDYFETRKDFTEEVLSPFRKEDKLEKALEFSEC